MGGVEGELLTTDLTIHRNADGTSDIDLFEFQLLADGGPNSFAEIQFSNEQGNLDLEVLDAAGAVVASSTSSDDDESVSLTDLAAGSYFARVFSPDDGTAEYQLLLHGPFRRSGFQIEINFTDDNMSPSQREAFTDAAARWSEIIVGDIPDTVLSDGTFVDDVIIDASAPEIDGPFGILGQAGPDEFRAGSALPAHGIMQFDLADINQMEADGSFVDVILHEMGHVLGIGTLWNFLGFVNGAGTDDPQFTGPGAVAEFSTLTGSDEGTVPVANNGGPGTRDAHWRESTFEHELMTGFLSGNERPISRLTIASLADIGYVVNFDAADPYDLNLPAGRKESGGSSSGDHDHGHGEIEVVGILSPGAEGNDTIGTPSEGRFGDAVADDLSRRFPADDLEGQVVELRTNQTLRNLTIQQGTRAEREDVFTFTLSGRGTFEDGIEVTSTNSGQSFNLELRDSDGNVLSRGLRGGHRLSLAGYQPGIYFVSVSSDDPNEYTFTFDGQFTDEEPAIAALDVDGNGDFVFSSDGVLLLAHSFGIRGDQLDTFRGAGNPRSGNGIDSTISLLADALDLDGDGEFRFATDGVILLADAFGISPAGLEAFTSGNATRNGDEIKARLSNLKSKASSGAGGRIQSPAAESSSFGFAAIHVSIAAPAQPVSPELPRATFIAPDDSPEAVSQFQLSAPADEPIFTFADKAESRREFEVAATELESPRQVADDFGKSETGDAFEEEDVRNSYESNDVPETHVVDNLFSASDILAILLGE